VRPTLDPDPERRPSSAGALAGELRSWLEADAAPAPTDPASDAPTLPAIPLPGVPIVAAVPPDQPAAPTSSAPVEPAPVGAAAGAPAGGRRDPRRPRDFSRLITAAIAVAAVLVALFILLDAVTAPNEPGPKPSPSGSPEASPSPTASPSPAATPAATPATFAEAVEAFKDLVDRGEEDGLIDGDAAEELNDRVDDVAHEMEDGSPGQINKAIRDLRSAIDRFARDGRIGSTDLADRLHEAVDEIEAAAARER
jgi:hypothetical protein